MGQSLGGDIVNGKVETRTRNGITSFETLGGTLENPSGMFRPSFFGFVPLVNTSGNDGRPVKGNK